MNRWASILPLQTFGRTVHQLGTPLILGGAPTPMPAPRYLVIEQRPDGHFLLRYSESGQFAGDTWHLNLEEAQGQARFEFGETLTWMVVPESESNPVSWLMTLGDRR